MLDRFMNYTVWSRKCLQYSKQERMLYQYELGLAMEKWASGLAIFQPMIKRLKAEYLHYKPFVKPRKGLVKKIKACTEEEKELYLAKPLIDKHNESSYYEHLRISTKKTCCNTAWIERLWRKYKLTESSIKQITNEILRCNFHDRFDNHLLVAAFKDSANRTEKINKTTVNKEERIKQAECYAWYPTESFFMYERLPLIDNMTYGFILPST